MSLLQEKFNLEIENYIAKIKKKISLNQLDTI